MKSRNLFIFAVIILMVWGNICCAQYDLTKITPPALTAMAFVRYSEIPVDISTGASSIEIPLYTVKSGRLEISISLF